MVRKGQVVVVFVDGRECGKTARTVGGCHKETGIRHIIGKDFCRMGPI